MSDSSESSSDSSKSATFSVSEGGSLSFSASPSAADSLDSSADCSDASEWPDCSDCASSDSVSPSCAGSALLSHLEGSLASLPTLIVVRFSVFECSSESGESLSVSDSSSFS